MNKNLSLVSKELFSKLRTNFPEISLKDEESNPTDKPSEARIFDFDYVFDGENLGRITITISDKDEDDDGDVDGLVVIYSNDITNDESDYSKKHFFNFLKELREFAKQKMLNFDTRDIAKSNLEKRDYKFLSKSGDGSMTESKLYGTNKTSFQQFGESKIIVKHSAPINLNSPAGRTQRIESIYIENSQGERFKYPFKHLNGARALAQHICHGGTPYDSIGQHITGLSEELGKLRMFKGYVDRNPMVSEAMSSINSKVMERLDQVKKEIFTLQNSGHYEQFAESFQETTSKEIPEEIMNDWIDRLTIKTFNEELKNVFPYIFNLVDESDIPVKNLTIEDLIDEEEDKEEEKEEKEVKEFTTFENFMNRIVEGTSDIFSDDEEAAAAAIDKLNELVAQPFPVGADGTNAIESLSEVIADDELMDVFKELADINPEQDVREILKDYIQIKDQENGTDILSQINFGEESAEEPVPAEPEAEPVAPAPEAPPAVEPPPAPAAAPAMPQPPIAEDRFARVIERAVKAGMKLEDTFEVAGRTMSLQDAIQHAGMKVEDFFGDKTQSAAGELIEFVKSMYNANEGSFPKGETGVLIACEKKFGEGAVPMAKKVVEKLTSLGETNRMRKLAGMGEGYYDLDQGNVPGMEPIDFSSKPSFKELITRYTQLVYQGHAGTTSDEEEQEYDDIVKYVADRFGEKGSAHLQKAGEVSYWGRDDKPFGRDIKSSNLGRPNQPGGDFRTTKAGKMHGQDAKMMKAKVADRLGKHPEPNLPEELVQMLKIAGIR